MREQASQCTHAAPTMPEPVAREVVLIACRLLRRLLIRSTLDAIYNERGMARI